MTDFSKPKARQTAKLIRAKVTGRADKAQALCRHFPWPAFKDCQFAGFWPLTDEINLSPLMTALDAKGVDLCLPVTGPPGTPLCFRRWTPNTKLQLGRFSTMEPPPNAAKMTPSFIFLPLLAFGPKGERLGYGGGYYDRTVMALRKTGEVFTCGVGFDAQEMANIPMLPHDTPLEAVLTPSGFRRFS